VIITQFLHRFYRLMQRRQPEVLWYGHESHREIALTFDDGPHPGDTPGVLDVLEKHGLQATFFLIGKDVEQNGKLVKEIHDRGHEIGIHCYRHRPFPFEDLQLLRKDLEETRNSLANLCDVSPGDLRDIRPPYGLFTHGTLSLFNEMGLRPVMWNCIPPHFLQPLSWSVKQVMDAALPGSIIVLHDGHGHGQKTAQIVDAVVPRLKAQGYEFVTIGQMQERKNS
jgi:peptidoglycan/xylan/chitin deacetylase (PgdA/CDA1 family)